MARVSRGTELDRDEGPDRRQVRAERHRRPDEPPAATSSTSPISRTTRCARRSASTGADVLVVRSTKVTAADARRRAAVAHRPRRRRLQHDRRRAALDARHLRLELPGQECHCRRGACVRADPRVGSPHCPTTSPSCAPASGTRRSSRRRAGLYGQTLGLLGVGSIGQEMIRRAAAFGMDVVVWSRRFDGEDAADERAGSARARHRGRARDSAASISRPRRQTSRRAPTSSACTSRSGRRRRGW